MPLSWLKRAVKCNHSVDKKLFLTGIFDKSVPNYLIIEPRNIRNLHGEIKWDKANSIKNKK